MRFTLLILTALTQAQLPQNTHFETGTFFNWKTMIADSSSILVETEPLTNRHTVVTPFQDEWTNGAITSVFAGNFSAKLGNDSSGEKSEAIETRFYASEDALILYRYAVVLDDPWHADGERPKLQAELFHEQSAGSCFTHSIQLHDSIGPLQTTIVNGHKIRFSNWRAGAFQIASDGYTALRFTTTDCALGGHFAYAYLEAQVIDRIKTIYYCGNDLLYLRAPDGFLNYQWSNGKNEQEIMVYPRDGAIYQCKLIPDFGCPVTIEFKCLKTYDLDCREYIPFFTPNNDGNNDYWQPEWRAGDLYCLIFDQNGRFITQIDYPKNWDGNTGSVPCDQADYWFEIISSTATRRNHFSLIRK